MNKYSRGLLIFALISVIALAAAAGHAGVGQRVETHSVLPRRQHRLSYPRPNSRLSQSQSCAVAGVCLVSTKCEAEQHETNGRACSDDSV